MLIHIVCWKYRSDVDPSVRSEHREKLRELAGTIPEVLSLQVGSDVLHLDRSFDTGLVATFADRSGLDIYTDHPKHQEVVTFGRSIADKVVSVDFLTD